MNLAKKLKKGVCVIDKLQRCIEKKKANNSQTREVIYKVLCNSNECLSVEEILALAVDEYPKKISLNTAYRNLRLLVECELVFMLQDDFKKAYYCLCSDEVDIFEVCPKCNKIKRVKLDICDAMKSSEFITLHKKCKKCL